MLVRKPMGISLQQPANVTHNIFIAHFPLPGINLFVLYSLCFVQTADIYLTHSSWAKHGGLGYFWGFFLLGIRFVGVCLAPDP